MKPIDFSYIRYANCWEDADLLMENTRPFSNASILSIASAGDNSLAFLAFAPKLVLAFDVNPTQLYLTELKQKCIKHFDYEEALCFLGFKDCKGREKMFHELAANLSIEARQYFLTNILLIKKGIIHQGKFEHYFYLFRKNILPFIHRKKTIDSLFENRTAIQQQEFYHENWNTWRWRLLFKFFFSKFILGRFGRDPQFFDETKLPVSSTIFNRAETHLQSEWVKQNHYLDYQLRGSFKINLPYYMRPDNFELIKHNIDKLQFYEGYLTDIPTEQKFDILNLSNIFEYMNVDQFKKQTEFLLNICHSSSKIAYWNLLVERKPALLDSRFIQEPIKGNDLCFFYQSFNLNTLKV